MSLTLPLVDSAAFTQSFDTKDVGTNKTLTPAGLVNDGFGGNDYAYTFAPVTSGTITALAITVTAVADTKTYDGTISSTKTPTLSLTLPLGDSAAFAQSFDTKDVGTGKTLTPKRSW